MHERDGEQCSFVSDDGRRCTERGFLEFDHVVPAARGGQPTESQIRLLCAAHNQYEAERVLGAAFMEERRARAELEADVVLALRGLGWTAADTRLAIAESAHVPATTLEERIRAALAVLHIRYTSHSSEASRADRP